MLSVTHSWPCGIPFILDIVNSYMLLLRIVLFYHLVLFYHMFIRDWSALLQVVLCRYYIAVIIILLLHHSLPSRLSNLLLKPTISNWPIVQSALTFHHTGLTGHCDTQLAAACPFTTTFFSGRF